MTLQELDLSKKYSYADYLQWTFEETVELIKGKLFKMSPAPSLEHQKVLYNLTLLTAPYFKAHQCEVFFAPFDVRLPKKGKSEEEIYTVVQPDLCVICELNKLDRRGCLGAPDWVVEILSPSTSRKDTHEKLEVYEESGVREYWLVHPYDKVITPFVLEEGVYQAKRPFAVGDVVSPFIFPELKIDLTEVFDTPNVD